MALAGAIGGGAVGEIGRLAALTGGGALDAGFSIYAPAILSGTVRGSVQLSSSKLATPTTLWWYAATGSELCFERKPPYRGVRISLYHLLDERRRDTGGSATNYRGVRISLYHSLGIAGLQTARNTLFGPFVSFGTTLFFPSFEPP